MNFLLFFFILVLLFSPGNISATDIEFRHFSVASQNLKTIEQNDRNLPVVGKAEVVVAGGGVAGVTAALRAAEDGYSVILLESRNYFGHEITATYKCHTQTGLPAQSSALLTSMYEDLTRIGALNGENIDPYALRSYLHQKVMEESRIKVYFYSMATGVVKANDRVQGVVFSGRDGRQVILAKSIIDATEDGRLAASAGAEMIRTMHGDKTARRFISVHLPESVPRGNLAVDGDSRLNDTRIVVHDDFVELELKTHIGENVALDLSKVHGKTLEKSFALRDYFKKNEWLPFDMLMDYRSGMVPAPETWIDETPVVAGQGTLNETELMKHDFSNSDIVRPIGIDGLVIAGRTVDRNPQMGSIQALLGTGELAGKTAGMMVYEADDYLDIATSDQKSVQIGNGPMISEILGGIDSGEAYPFIHQSSVDLPVRGEYDVVVVGGGTSGAIAAISAARQGASVAVLEILPNLGGIGSNTVETYYWGAPWKSTLRRELGDGIHVSKRGGGGPLEKVDFSGEDKKFTLQVLAFRAGVHIYFKSLGAGAVVDSNQVRGVVVENASGRHVLLADVVIDATGHAGIAVAAGAGYAKGRDTDGFLHETRALTLRDPTNIDDISKSYLRVPSTMISLSIRESRRVTGDYRVTFEDQINERQFPDVVSKWRSNYDTHFPNSANMSDLAQDWTTILGLWRKPIIGSIPYRSLLPQGLDHILVAAMAYSSDHDALIGGRMQPDMEHLGEAAGVAAAMASRMEVSPRNIPVEELQNELVRLGVLRDEDVLGRTITGGPSLEQLHQQDFWKEERDEQFPANPARLTLEERTQQLGTDQALEAMHKLYLAGEEAIPLLQPLLESNNQRIHEEAAVLLGLLGDRSVIPALMGFLEERNTRRFEFTLPHATSRPSVPLYWSAVIFLGRFGESDAVPAMMELLSKPPPPEEFGMLTRSQYGVDMFQNTHSCPPPLASFIIVALGRIGDAQAAEAIRPYLAVSNEIDMSQENRDFEISWGVQTNAAWALAQMGDLSGVPELITLLDADKALLRNYARYLLETITDEQHGMDRKAWQEWWGIKE